MGHKRDYEIAFVGLKPGTHEYSYEITDKFFDSYQQQDFTNCNALVKLSLDKNTGFMLLKFEVGGSLDTHCDRCGNPLTIQLWDEFNIIVKMVEEPELMNDQEEDPDVYYIGRQESHIDVADWIYEFINLSIPIQNICGNKEDGSDCNPAALDALRKMKISEGKVPKENPIWKGLEQFKDLDKKQ